MKRDMQGTYTLIFFHKWMPSFLLMRVKRLNNEIFISKKKLRNEEEKEEEEEKEIW